MVASTQWEVGQKVCIGNGLYAYRLLHGEPSASACCGGLRTYLTTGTVGTVIYAGKVRLLLVFKLWPMGGKPYSVWAWTDRDAVYVP